MIVDLHFVTIMHRHPCFTGFDGNTDENSRIVVFIAHLEHNVNFTVADLSSHAVEQAHSAVRADQAVFHRIAAGRKEDRKSTRLNSSHVASSYAAFCSTKQRPAQ